MNTVVQNKIKEIAKDYKENNDVNKAFKNVMDVLSDHNINDYSLYSDYFNYEQNISYLLFKESYKLIAKDSYENINNPENEDVYEIINKLAAGCFSSLAFGTEEYYLSQAAKDAYSEVWGDEMEAFEKTALTHKMDVLNQVIKNNPKEKERMIKFVINDSEKSVYKEQIKSMTNKIK